MNNINKTPSNELFVRIHSNKMMTKNLKKDVLNLYKRHPNAAVKAIELIEEIERNNVIPHGATFTDAEAYIYTETDFDNNANLSKIKKDKLNNAVNILVYKFMYMWKKLPSIVEYTILEYRDGTFETVVWGTSR